MGKCIYCGSSNYGRSCTLSPTKTHAHLDEPEKCIYCGSKNTGIGCTMNPYGKMHVKGGAIYMQVKETTQKSVLLAYLIESLKRPKTGKGCYVSPMDRFFKRFSESVKKNMIPLVESLSLVSDFDTSSLNEDQKKLISEMLPRLQDQVDNLKETVEYLSMTLPPEVVEKELLRATLKE